MSQDNQSSLHFSVEESVWFQKGQEVAQLMSVSLDPEIAIHEYEQYVSIRGALTLTGEYEKYDEDFEASLREYTHGKQVEDVHTREDGTNEFTYYFPVDITIPRNRIQSVDQVFVAIESFDYDLPSADCLQVVADLSIAGLYGEQQSTARESDYALQEEEVQEEPYQEFQEVTFDRDQPISSYEEYQQVEVTEEEVDALYRSSTAEAEQEQEVEYEEVKDYFASFSQRPLTPEPTFEADDEFNEPFTVEVKKTFEEEPVSYARTVEQEQEKEVAQQERETAEWQEEEPVVYSEPEPVEEVIRHTAYKPYVAEFEETNKKSEPAEQMVIDIRQEKQESGEKRKENALYLTKLFSKSAEEDFTRLKVCIVQEGESLEQIAHRYSLNVQQILRVNSIEEDERLKEGQLINIPTYKQ
ncbi:stage VI sporulation protein D [Priestia koreensis]|uniref:stage VI sporulation protein D n=1 Tax=Priestia koreensis TaxID=284581 RepID=UPI003458387B